jgi:chemotaxis protein MotB
MLKRLTRIMLPLIWVITAAACSGQKIQTLKDAVCCDGGYEYRYGDRLGAENATGARLAALEKDRQRLGDELAASRKETDALAAKSRSLEEQLADRDRELASLRSTAGDSSKLAAELATSQADRDRLAAALAASQASLVAVQAGAGDKDTLAEQLAQANKRNSELEAQVTAINTTGADKDKLAAELAASRQRISDLETQLADRERQLAGLRGDLSAEMAKLKEAQRGLVRALRPQIEKGSIMVDLNNERLLINLASGYLFGSGEDQLKPAGADALKQVGAILKDFPEYKVSVEGHTDNRPIRSELKKKFASNMQLSEARAANAAVALGEGGLSAVTTQGYADTKPVMPNTSDAGRAKNRRVEVLVTK